MNRPECDRWLHDRFAFEYTHSYIVLGAPLRVCRKQPTSHEPDREHFGETSDAHCASDFAVCESCTTPFAVSAHIQLRICGEYAPLYSLFCAPGMAYGCKAVSGLSTRPDRNPAVQEFGPVGP